MTSSPPAASSSSSRRRSSGWVALPEMTVGRFRPGAVVMDGKMYVAGGKDPVSHKDLDSMEVFDDVTQKWYLRRLERKHLQKLKHLKPLMKPLQLLKKRLLKNQPLNSRKNLYDTK